MIFLAGRAGPRRCDFILARRVGECVNDSAQFLPHGFSSGQRRCRNVRDYPFPSPALSDSIVSGAPGNDSLSSRVWYLALISIQDSGFQAICRNTVAGLMIGIQTAFENVRKEQGNENQDEFESWFWRGQTDREHKPLVQQSGVLTSVGRRGFRRKKQ